MVQKTPYQPSLRFLPEETLSLYIREVAKNKVLPLAAERELLKRAQAGDRKALNALVQANLKFVISVARNYVNHGLPMADLINEGNLGLIRAAERFDLTREFRFISYAVWWIRQGIMAALARQPGFLSIPPNWAAETRVIRRADQKLTQKLGRAPAFDELREESGLAAETLRAHGSYLQGSALPLRAEGDGGQDPLDGLAAPGDDYSPEHEAELALVRRALDETMGLLTPRERMVLRMFFGYGVQTTYTLQEIAERIGASRERVRQIKTEALGKLRRTARMGGIARPEEHALG